MGHRKPRFSRFDTFVGISIALHAIAFVALVVFALLPKSKPPLDLASFELVGPPPRGNDGGSSPLPSAAHPEPAAPDPTEEAAEPPPPEPEAIPVSKPTVATKSVTTPEKPSQEKTTAKPASPAATNSSNASTGQSSSAPQGTSGKPGKAGTPGGDTLSVGGGQGLPSPMALWLSRVKYLVERNWRAPPGLAGVSGMPEVVFSVARDGRGSMAQLRKKSGNPTLDRLALRAIQSVDLFPPVPDVWPEDKVVVRYVLQYAP